MVVVLKKMLKRVGMDTLKKAMIKLYKLMRKPKNVRKGKAAFQKQEEETLKACMLEEEGEEEEEKEEEEGGSDEDEAVVEKKKRKKYAELKSGKTKKARVKNFVQKMRNDDDGLEVGVFDHLKAESEVSSDKKVSSEEWKLCCLKLHFPLSDDQRRQLQAHHHHFSSSAQNS
jgi:hypothetical protein